jgi:predicted trehalose synthase
VEEKRVEVIKFHQSSPSRWDGGTVKRLLALFVLFLGVLNTPRGWAQTASTTQASNQPASASSSAVLAAFQAEQQALGESLHQLVAQGATPAQIEAWHQQNASRIAAQQQRAQAMSAAQPRQPMPYATDVEIPEGASQTMEDFLTVSHCRCLLR